jgi:hypothetical protein
MRCRGVGAGGGEVLVVVVLGGNGVSLLSLATLVCFLSFPRSRPPRARLVRRCGPFLSWSPRFTSSVASRSRSVTTALVVDLNARTSRQSCFCLVLGRFSKAAVRLFLLPLRSLLVYISCLNSSPSPFEHAYAAANEAADLFLAPILSLPIDEAATLTPQSARCKALFDKTHSDFLPTLNALEQETLLENASLLARTALDVLPSSAALTLTNREVSAALHFKTFSSGQAETCSKCFLDNDVDHPELCKGFLLVATSRHDSVKRQIAHSLKSCPSFEVVVEPTVPGTDVRTDLRVTSDTGVKEFDLTIIALSSVEARTISTSTRSKLSLDDPRPSLESVASSSLQAVLAHAAKDKVNKYQHLQVPFGALAFTLGGAAEDSAMETLRGWREELGPSYSFLMRRISVVLLQMRAKIWKF